jgi:hypothetical protein
VRCNKETCEHNDQSNGCMLGNGESIRVTGHVSGAVLIVDECSEDTTDLPSTD